MLSTEILPAATDKPSRTATCFKQVSEKPEPHWLRWHGVDRPNILVALAASILIHAGVLAVILALVHAIRPAAPHNQYVYITLREAQPGIAMSSEGSRQEPHRYLPKISRHVAGLHRILRRGRKPIRKVPALTSSVDEPSLVKSTPARSVLAKSNTTNKSPIILNGEGDSSGSRPGESSGNGSAGSVPGAVVYQAPVLLSSTIPSYPERARRLGIEGRVVLRFIVDQLGRVEREIRVVTSVPMLDQAAIDAVRQWRFSPGRDRNGNPVRVLVSVPLQFTLR